MSLTLQSLALAFVFFQPRRNLLALLGNNSSGIVQTDNEQCKHNNIMQQKFLVSLVVKVVLGVHY